MSKSRREFFRRTFIAATAPARLRQILGFYFLVMAAGLAAASARAQMDPFFTAINYPEPKGHAMLMFLPDFQIAHQGNDFITEMGMAEYGVTSRWTVGAMAEGQKISGLPGSFGGLRFNTYFQVFPSDHWLHFTVYGEYEDLNGAALYKMEVSGFGGEDLTGPLAVARRTAAHTFEQRAIVYHDWGRLNLTFNFISETNLQTWENDFGYAWGIYRQPRWTGMRMAEGTPMAAPPPLSLFPPPSRSGVGDDRRARKRPPFRILLAQGTTIPRAGVRLPNFTSLVRSLGTRLRTFGGERPASPARGRGMLVLNRFADFGGNGLCRKPARHAMARQWRYG